MKTLIALSLLALSFGFAGPAAAMLKASATTPSSAELTSEEKAYLVSIEQDPDADFIKTMKPADKALLKKMIHSQQPADQKRDQVSLFLDDVVARLIWGDGPKKV